MLLHEILDATTTARICADGCLVADVRAARTGIQQYLGREVDPDNAHGLRDKATVNIYRPESEVFSRDSLASFVAAPVTIDHPSVAVDASNWRQLGVGEINGDVVRDGGFVRVPIIVRDAAAVAKVNSTHKQLSMGYSTQLVFPQDGKHPDGTACDAYQTQIRINHIAAVRAARGGSELKISDERPLHQKEPAMAGTIIVDGLPVSLADEAAVRAVIEKKDKAINEGESALADAKTALSTEQGKVAALEKRVADAEAAATPAALDQRVADRAALITLAKAVDAKVVTDGKTDAEIRKAVVASKLGDKAPTEDAAISGAFAVLTADVKPNEPTVRALGMPTIVGDTASIRDAARNFRNVA